VVVVGGANSNNTRELVETCRRACERVYHVQGAADLRPDWFVGAEVAGITAGTSTPDSTIDAVERWLEAWIADRRAVSSADRSDHLLESALG
jgi:4-hydroxy-3-methylbut-2-enyl diphosphate reductase